MLVFDSEVIVLFILSAVGDLTFGEAGPSGVDPPDHQLHFSAAFVPDAVFLFSFNTGGEAVFTDPTLLTHLISDIVPGVGVAVREHNGRVPSAGNFFRCSAEEGKRK